jgi:hypothetical protein
VLGEKPIEGLVSLDAIAPAPKRNETRTEEPVMGD